MTKPTLDKHCYLCRRTIFDMKGQSNRDVVLNVKNGVARCRCANCKAD